MLKVRSLCEPKYPQLIRNLQHQLVHPSPIFEEDLRQTLGVLSQQVASLQADQLAEILYYLGKTRVSADPAQVRPYLLAAQEKMGALSPVGLSRLLRGVTHLYRVHRRDAFNQEVADVRQQCVDQVQARFLKRHAHLSLPDLTLVLATFAKLPDPEVVAPLFDQLGQSVRRCAEAAGQQDVLRAQPFILHAPFILVALARTGRWQAHRPTSDALLKVLCRPEIGEGLPDKQVSLVLFALHQLKYPREPQGHPLIQALLSRMTPERLHSMAINHLALLTSSAARLRAYAFVSRVMTQVFEGRAPDIGTPEMTEWVFVLKDLWVHRILPWEARQHWLEILAAKLPECAKRAPASFGVKQLDYLSQIPGLLFGESQESQRIINYARKSRVLQEGLDFLLHKLTYGGMSRLSAVELVVLLTACARAQFVCDASNLRFYQVYVREVLRSLASFDQESLRALVSPIFQVNICRLEDTYCLVPCIIERLAELGAPVEGLHQTVKDWCAHSPEEVGGAEDQASLASWRDPANPHRHAFERFLEDVRAGLT